MKLDITDISERLGLPASTVDRWVRQGRIPVERAQGGWAIEEAVLKRWAASRQLPLVSKPQPTAPATATTVVEAMNRGGIWHDLPGDSVDTVLAAAVARLTPLTEDQQSELVKWLLDREALNSTGVGNGIAIPHPRTPSLEGIDSPTILTAFLHTPVPYHAVDAQPVFVLFLLLSPTTQAHLHLLSRLSFCIRDTEFQRGLKAKPDGPTLLEAVAAIERRLDT